MDLGVSLYKFHWKLSSAEWRLRLICRVYIQELGTSVSHSTQIVSIFLWFFLGLPTCKNTIFQMYPVLLLIFHVIYCIWRFSDCCESIFLDLSSLNAIKMRLNIFHSRSPITCTTAEYFHQIIYLEILNFEVRILIKRISKLSYWMQEGKDVKMLCRW